MPWQTLWRTPLQQAAAGLRFRQLLVAAHHSGYYREAAFLPEAIRTPVSEFPVRFPDLIARFPVLRHDAFRQMNARFRRLPRFARFQFFFPLKPIPKTALLLAGAPARGRIRRFAHEDVHALSRFAPELIAGSVTDLLALSDANRRAHGILPPLRRAVIVYTGLDLPPLEEALREEIYARFEVPVFEQLLGLDGELLAWECQAHDGLHLARENGFLEIASGAPQGRVLFTSFRTRPFPVIRLQTHLTARMETAACACGSSLPRLFPLADAQPKLPQPVPQLEWAAATA